jgi:hypothetical protein
MADQPHVFTVHRLQSKYPNFGSNFENKLPGKPGPINEMIIVTLATDFLPRHNVTLSENLPNGDANVIPVFRKGSQDAKRATISDNKKSILK